MKNGIFALTMTMTLILSAAIPARAASSAAYDADFKKILTHSTTMSQVYMIMALAGAPPEAIRAVQADMQKSNVANQLASVDLVKNEFVANGKKTGISVISYSPPQVKYLGRIWKFAPGQSMDKSYFSFMQMVSGGNKSASHWFINEAEAFEPDPSGGGQAGLLTKGTGALVVGGIACLLTTICPTIVGGVLIAGGAAATLIPGVRPAMEVKCGKLESSISMVVDGKSSGSFKVVKRNDGSYAAQQLDDVSQSWHEYEPSDKAGFDKLAKCETSAEAAQLKKTLDDKISSAVSIAKGGGSKPAGGAQLPADSAN